MPFECGTRLRRPSPTASQREVVELAESYVRAHMGTPVPLSRLCRLVGRSERGLRNAFYCVRGMSPTRSMLVERLESVRDALSGAGVTRTTVTNVAIQYGFYELGRFAASYKKAFGEAPSATLRAAGRRSAGERMTRGHAHAGRG